MDPHYQGMVLTPDFVIIVLLLFFFSTLQCHLKLMQLNSLAFYLKKESYCKILNHCHLYHGKICPFEGEDKGFH